MTSVGRPLSLRPFLSHFSGKCAIHSRFKSDSVTDSWQVFLHGSLSCGGLLEKLSKTLVKTVEKPGRDPSDSPVMRSDSVGRVLLRQASVAFKHTTVASFAV